MKPEPRYLKVVILIIAVMALISMDLIAQDKGPNQQVVAVVNAIPLTEADIQLEIKRIQFQAKIMRQPIDDSMMEAMREKVIQSIINRELLFQESKAKGILVDALEIDIRIDQIKQQLDTGQELENRLTEMGISMEEFRSQVNQATAIQKLLSWHKYPFPKDSE